MVDGVGESGRFDDENISGVIDIPNDGQWMVLGESGRSDGGKRKKPCKISRFVVRSKKWTVQNLDSKFGLRKEETRW